METSELQELLAGWQGMELPPERQEHLLKRLREDRDLRKALVGEIRIVSMSRTVMAAEPRWLALADELGRDPGYDSQMQLMESGIHEKLAGESSPIVPAWWRPAAIIASAVGAILLIIAGWLYFENASGRHPVDDTATLAVAVLVDGCEWEVGGSQKPILNSAVHAGTLKIHRGEISLAFLSGVTLNIKGPTEVEIKSIDHIFCKRGLLRVSVPESAVGFTVLAPGAAVVDMGSEFAVDVRSTGQTRLTVLEGRARASVFSKDGAVREQVVDESKSVEIDPANFRITDVAAPKTMQNPPMLSIPPLILSPNYPAIVCAAKPWGYWRCEDIIDGVISNEVPDGVPLMLNGALSIANEGGKNHSIAFGPNDTTQFLGTRPDWTPPATGCAIELCFASAGYSASSLVSIMAATNNGHFMLLELLAKGERPGDKPGGLRLLYRSPPAESGGISLYSQKLYVPKRWHHIVAQHLGTRLQLFIDGQPAGETKLGSVAEYDLCRAVFGRFTDMATPDTRAFVGRIDEIALYGRPLKPEEIAAHAKAALGK